MVKGKSGEEQIAEDEEPKRYNEDKISLLKPAFSKTGTITAANASKINDGGCAISTLFSYSSFDVRRESKELRS